jgi:hypothetical protein
MLVLLFVAWTVALLSFGARAAAPPKPNIIFIYADDMGYGDLGCYGARAVRTPNLDRMAAGGLRLSSFYSVSPVCTPSRTALMTGRYAARMGIQQMHLSNVLTFQDQTGLPTEETTVATALKARGYATACIGKWHLGHVAPHRPIDHGFDYYYGIPYSNDMKPSILMRMGEVIEEPVKQETVTRRYTEEAVRFMEGTRDRPFFLYFFDKEFLQTARAGRWKIHVARWNIPRYTGASGQQKNVTLKEPELYDMSLDDGESYDVADRNPAIVKLLQERIAEALRSFPEEIRKANAELITPERSH